MIKPIVYMINFFRNMFYAFLSSHIGQAMFPAIAINYPADIQIFKANSTSWASRRFEGGIDNELQVIVGGRYELFHSYKDDNPFAVPDQWLLVDQGAGKTVRYVKMEENEIPS